MCQVSPEFSVLERQPEVGLVAGLLVEGGEEHRGAAHHHLGYTLPQLLPQHVLEHFPLHVSAHVAIHTQFTCGELIFSLTTLILSTEKASWMSKMNVFSHTGALVFIMVLEVSYGLAIESGRVSMIG